MRSTAIHARPVNASTLREAAERVENAEARREEFAGLAAPKRKGSPAQEARADAVSFSSTLLSAPPPPGRMTPWRRQEGLEGDVPVGLRDEQAPGQDWPRFPQDWRWQRQ